MVKELFNKINGWLEDGLRGVLGRLSPDHRVFLVLAMLSVFGGLSIYMTVSSIYNLGRKDGIQLDIERIESLQTGKGQAPTDSMNRLNEFHNGRGDFE